MTKPTALLRLGAIAVCATLLGCHLSVDCVSVAHAAVSFTLRDSVSRAEVTTGATAVLIGSTFADSAVIPPGVSRSQLGTERDGRMTLSIRALGFSVWQRTFTNNRTGDCRALAPVELDVLLQRIIAS